MLVVYGKGGCGDGDNDVDGYDVYDVDAAADKDEEDAKCNLPTKLLWMVMVEVAPQKWSDYFPCAGLWWEKLNLVSMRFGSKQIHPPPLNNTSARLMASRYQ